MVEFCVKREYDNIPLFYILKKGYFMAITKIHAIKSALSNAILYIGNPSKTDGQLLVSGYNVEPQTAALDFEITAMMAHKVRHISCKKTSNLAYHLIQSFSPTEKITPREAHDLGRKLALEFTEGKYEFVIATHIDKGHIHNHIIINSVSFYDYKKLRTVPYRTAQQIRSISDRLCMEAQLSVIKDPQQLGQLYPTYVQKKRTTSNRTEVRNKLNFCLERATNYAQFLQMAQELGISVCQRGKHMTYLLDGAGRAIRDTSLADTDKFTYAGLMERLEDNAAEQLFIRERIAKIFPSVSTFTDFIKQLQSEGVNKLQGITGCSCADCLIQSLVGLTYGLTISNNLHIFSTVNLSGKTIVLFYGSVRCRCQGTAVVHPFVVGKGDVPVLHLIGFRQ